jgi:hypothetical protein
MLIQVDDLSADTPVERRVQPCDQSLRVQPVVSCELDRRSHEIDQLLDARLDALES